MKEYVRPSEWFQFPAIEVFTIHQTVPEMESLYVPAIGTYPKSGDVVQCEIVNMGNGFLKIVKKIL